MMGLEIPPDPRLHENAAPHAQPPGDEVKWSGPPQAVSWNGGRTTGRRALLALDQGPGLRGGADRGQPDPTSGAHSTAACVATSIP